MLRGNRKGVGQLRNPFGKGDPRLSSALNRCEPKIHFALVCGAKSCPAIKTYSVQVSLQQHHVLWLAVCVCLAVCALFLIGMYISLIGMYISLIGMYISLIGMYISLIGMFISLIGMYISALGVYHVHSDYLIF